MKSLLTTIKSLISTITLSENLPSKGNTAKQNQLQPINQETQQKEYHQRKRIYLLNKKSKDDPSQNQKLKFHKKIDLKL